MNGQLRRKPCSLVGMPLQILASTTGVEHCSAVTFPMFAFVTGSLTHSRSL